MDGHPNEPLDSACAGMAPDAAREAEALEWIDGVVDDLKLHEPPPQQPYSATA